MPGLLKSGMKKWWIVVGLGVLIFAFGYYSGGKESGKSNLAFLVTVPEFEKSDGDTYVKAEVKIKSLTLVLKAVGWFIRGRGSKEILIEGNGAEILSRLIGESKQERFTIDIYDEVRENRSHLLTIKTSLVEDTHPSSVQTLDKVGKRY